MRRTDIILVLVYFSLFADCPLGPVCINGMKNDRLGVERGLSLWGPHLRRACKDTGMNSRGFVEGPIGNASPEFCATPLIYKEYL